MSLFITSLNSGSNGNCYYVGNYKEAILVDVGISCREIEKRMKNLGLSLGIVKAIFVSHEHGDHIKGVSTLSNKYNIPVYITAETAKNGPILIKHLSKNFLANVPISIGDLVVTPFSKEHDAIDPHSFIISYSGITVGVITDIGVACNQVVQYFKQCHAVFLESNYDEDLLKNGSYPIYLKNRISGGKGHISNKQALDLFITYKPTFLSHLLLSHLSKENNSPEIASSLFKLYAGDTKIIVASRYKASEVYNISSKATNNVIANYIQNKPTQLGLF